MRTELPISCQRTEFAAPVFQSALKGAIAGSLFAKLTASIEKPLFTTEVEPLKLT
jgi:hypothetical protein